MSFVDSNFFLSLITYKLLRILNSTLTTLVTPWCCLARLVFPSFFSRESLSLVENMFVSCFLALLYLVTVADKFFYLFFGWKQFILFKDISVTRLSFQCIWKLLESSVSEITVIIAYIYRVSDFTERAKSQMKKCSKCPSRVDLEWKGGQVGHYAWCHEDILTLLKDLDQTWLIYFRSKD